MTSANRNQYCSPTRNPAMSVTKLTVTNPVATIELNRPAAMNSLNPELRHALSLHFDEVANNDDIWVAVVTGAGDKAFCAGADLKHRARERDASTEQRKQWADMLAETTPLNERWQFPKPVIAKVNGFALGGGLELALACDIIVAADHAELGLPEPRRGLIAGAAGVHRLPRQIGLKQAMGYMLTGRHMSAERAYQLGLVNEVVPADQLGATVDGRLRMMPPLVSQAACAAGAASQRQSRMPRVGWGASVDGGEACSRMPVGPMLSEVVVFEQAR